MMPKEIKVLYIAGWGRSGSTILDNLLGELDGFFSGGEIHYLWSRGLIERRSCGCGLGLETCPVWSCVLRELRAQEGLGSSDPALVVRWQKDSVRIRHAWRLLRSKPPLQKDDAMSAYARVLGATYAVLEDVTGARVIVDSSKRPSDAAALRLVPGIAPYYVHLVRDPRAVAYSWRRRKAHLDTSAPAELSRHGPINSTVSWTTWNLAIEALKRRHDPARSLLVRYEDFVAGPRRVVEDIVTMLGETAPSLPFEDATTARLSGNHTISGNPSRFSTGLVALRPDDEWWVKQSPVDRVIATGLGLPLLRRYGYALRPRPTSAEAGT